VGVAPGQSLEHYRLVEKIGEGGMGAVWKAVDTTLDRAVAIKILPDGFAADSERLARFEREARLLASLNHPGIATIHGLHAADGVRFLVMELVDGENLAQRLDHGPLPVEEAVEVALQVARALEAAHERGVIHRDLKPANIQMTAAGQPKILDFGLAKAMLPDVGSGDQSLSPTLTSMGTQAGVILGTAAYMSPEQARGKAVDRRADIWSFGMVVYEMLTGDRAFQGETISDTLAAILVKEVDLSGLPAETPPWLRDLLARCLRKEPDKRLRDIGDARLTLEERPQAVASPARAGAGAGPLPPRLRRLPWGLAALALVAAAVFVVLYLQANSRSERIVHATIPQPPGTTFFLDGGSPGPVQVSVDGSALTFTARDASGTVLIWVRQLDTGGAVPLSGTDGAQYPFWSPDGRYIGFFADGKLKKVAATGGPPVALADAGNGKGGSWNEEGKILFAPSYNTPLHLVSSAGGDTVPVTALDVEAGEDSHRHPFFLPGGRHFLYLARHGETGGRSGARENEIFVGSLDGGDPVPLLRGEANAVYSAGHVLFVRDDTLMAQPFDPGARELRGEAFPVAEGLAVLRGAAVGVFSGSRDGVLAYLTGVQVDRSRLVWFDRDGKELGTVGEEGSIELGRLSPDATRVAIAVRDPSTGNQDVWIQDLERGLRARFTFDPGLDDLGVWYPDGSRIIFASDRNGRRDLWMKPVAGAGQASLLLESDADKRPVAISPDGRRLLYFQSMPGEPPDLMMLSLQGDPEPVMLVASPKVDAWGDFSSDGEWVVYSSDESGRFEVYARYLSAPDRRWQISPEGGIMPRWSRDGREIFYWWRSAIYAVEVAAQGDDLSVGAAGKLFDTGLTGASWAYVYDVAPDGKRFLLSSPGDAGEQEALTLVVNWTGRVAQE
jgi:Tol biopolymer transport system component